MQYSLSSNIFHPVNENYSKVYRQKKGRLYLVSPDDDVIVDFMNAMAAHASELEIAKKNLTDAIGDNVKQ